jgi:hypothetical protein
MVPGWFRSSLCGFIKNEFIFYETCENTGSLVGFNPTVNFSNLFSLCKKNQTDNIGLKVYY